MLKMRQVSKSVEECFEDFINSKRANGLREKTLKTYSQQFQAISKELNTEMEIGELSKRDVEKMVVSMRDRGLSANSIRSYTAMFKSFLSWCSEEGLCDVSIKSYKAQETVKTTYTNDELKALLQKPNTKSCSFAEYRNWVIINMLLNSGCRAATIRNIKIQDVDIQSSIIQYRHTKNGSVQMVPLCQEMKKILKEYMKIRGGKSTDYLFPSEDESQMTENGLSEAIRRYNRRRGVEKTSIHLFRHSFAERYLRNGGNAFDLQRILGHSTLEMTKHYCRIYDTQLIKGYDSVSPLGNLIQKKFFGIIIL